MNLIFITHPEVIVDPSVPVVEWQLSAEGARRMREFTGSDVAQRIQTIWCSHERKAIEAAGILGGIAVSQDIHLGENDRGATGFLPPAEFERMADAFFANPEQDVRGWERAIDAQSRIRSAVDRIIDSHSKGDLAIVSHGAVGTLLRSAYLGRPINRDDDQPFQGHFWVASLPERKVLHGWRSIAPRRASNI